MTKIRVGDEVFHETRGVGLVTDIRSGNSAGVYVTVLLYEENTWDQPSRVSSFEASDLEVIS